MFDQIFTAEALVSLLTLTLLEVVLGIDNIIFISIQAGKLPREQQNRARRLGLFIALFVRIGLLFGISWIVGLKQDWFSIFGMGFSGRDLILLGGGLFLTYKSTHEIHEKLEGETVSEDLRPVGSALSSVILQIVLLDIVFSFDSILTAVGLVRQVEVMILAVILAMFIMLAFSEKISDFVNDHPTIKMLALSFLLMIGMMLVAEALEFEIPKGYIYFSMAFSLVVELLNMRSIKKQKPVKLRDQYK
ncbi:MAG: TerC family protein [Ferruginibacter sp.]|nr:TerC family protein [Cytophagales bacterium]